MNIYDMEPAARARLIAAAPDLLVTSKRLAKLASDPKQQQSTSDYVVQWREAWVALRAAIAKAEGVS